MAPPLLVESLRAALRAAMTARDRTAMSALRSAIAAVDNASAVDVRAIAPTASGPITKAVTGVGATEAPRKLLTDEETRAVVEREITERLEAAAGYERGGRCADARRLQAEALIIEAVLDPSRSESQGAR